MPRATKPPKQIRVGPLTYSLKFGKQKKKAEEAYGYTELDKLSILVREDMPLQKRKVITVHESLHAMFHNAGLFQDKDALEERVTVTMTTTLFQWLQDNPELIAWLQEID